MGLGDSKLLLLEGDGIARGREMMALSEGKGVVAEHRAIRKYIRIEKHTTPALKAICLDSTFALSRNCVHN